VIRVLEVAVSHVVLVDDSDEHLRKHIINVDKPLTAEQWEGFPDRIAELIADLEKKAAPADEPATKC
jgi:hypothetical protein